MRIAKIEDLHCNAGWRDFSFLKITTDDGLVGWSEFMENFGAEGLSTVIQRLGERLIGMDPRPVERITVFLHGLTRQTPYGINQQAIAAIENALVDIKAKSLNIPVYQLLGGKAREAALTYATVGGMDAPEAIDHARAVREKGFRCIKIMTGVPGMAAYGPRGGPGARGLHEGPVFDADPYMRHARQMLEECRKQLGEEIGLIHDVHERVSPHEAVQFAKDLEPIRLFYLEDVLSPEDIDYFRQIRQQCATSLAMGELFNSPHEWQPLIAGRLIDYIRVHLSQAGGLTPARKIAILGEQFGVKTAWHGPGDVSPVGHTAQLHLDLASYNFGIQEGGIISGVEAEIFTGCAAYKDGYLWASESPGWGIEVNEQLAARYPFRDGPDHLNGGWGEIRQSDGAIIKQ